MVYLIIGAIICIIGMSAYDWPTLNEFKAEWGVWLFSVTIWAIFIILLWPIVLGVWILGAAIQYLNNE